jgi:hypothetical protein
VLGFFILIGTIIDLKRRWIKNKNDDTDDDEEDMVDDKHNFSIIQPVAIVNKGFKGEDQDGGDVIDEISTGMICFS